LLHAPIPKAPNDTIQTAQHREAGAPLDQPIASRGRNVSNSCLRARTTVECYCTLDVNQLSRRAVAARRCFIGIPLLFSDIPSASALGYDSGR
jgi:hypothetical protein